MGKRPPDSLDDILTGTTLKVYRALIRSGEPIGPRELQKILNLSSPSVASFHLDKLERSGLATKNDQGAYSVNTVYLKHYVRLQRRLIPRYMFHATLATFLLLGWVLVYFSHSFSVAFHDSASTESSALFLVFSYGVLVSAVLAGLFWYETIGIMRKEKI
jgi:DNA-binding transcriptional ArsR family regulator